MDFFKNSMQKFRLFGRGKSVKHNLKKCRLYRKMTWSARRGYVII